MGGHAQIFKAEGKLVPNLVRDNLSVRALHNKADFAPELSFIIGFYILTKYCYPALCGVVIMRN